MFIASYNRRRTVRIILSTAVIIVSRWTILSWWLLNHTCYYLRAFHVLRIEWIRVLLRNRKRKGLRLRIKWDTLRPQRKVENNWSIILFSLFFTARSHKFHSLRSMEGLWLLIGELVGDFFYWFSRTRSSRSGVVQLPMICFPSATPPLVQLR